MMGILIALNVEVPVLWKELSKLEMVSTRQRNPGDTGVIPRRYWSIVGHWTRAKSDRRRNLCWAAIASPAPNVFGTDYKDYHPKSLTLKTVKRRHKSFLSRSR